MLGFTFPQAEGSEHSSLLTGQRDCYPLPAGSTAAELHHVLRHAVTCCRCGEHKGPLACDVARTHEGNKTKRRG